MNRGRIRVYRESYVHKMQIASFVVEEGSCFIYGWGGVKDDS